MKVYSVALASILFLLTACSAFPAATDPLDGTSWELFAYRKTRPIEDSTITISFEDEQVSGSGGCNSYGGEYQVNGGRIEFGMLMATAMACADPAMMNQETMFMQFLGDAQRFELTDGQLQIYWSDREALTFIPAE